MTDSHCIVYSCSCFYITRSNNDSVISTCYLTVIANDNCIIGIRYGILRTDSSQMLYIRTFIADAHNKVICTFGTISTCYGIVNTNHGCTQCVVCLVATTEGHSCAAALSSFYGIFYSPTQFIRIIATACWCTRNTSDRISNFITCTEYQRSIRIISSISHTYNTIGNTGKFRTRACGLNTI